MSKTSIQKGSKIETGIKLHLKSFLLPEDLIKDQVEYRLSITAMPERNKQYYFVHGKKLKDFDHYFELNISNKTQEIIIVVRRKDFIENDPIVASSVIRSEYFPEIPQNIDDLGKEKKPTDEIIHNIMEPRHQKDATNKVRKVIGNFKFQMCIIPPIPSSNKESIKNNNKLFEIFDTKGINNNAKNEEPKYNSYTEYILF